MRSALVCSALRYGSSGLAARSASHCASAACASPTPSRAAARFRRAAGSPGRTRSARPESAAAAAAKYYAIDNGLRRVNSCQKTEDTGHRLENAIYLELRRKQKMVHYAGEIDTWECDFVTDTDAIQVCLRLTPENMGHEVRGALAAAALPGSRRSLILTLDQRDTIKADGAVVEVWPAWQWLTGGVPEAPKSN
jgi:hypothetical protein